MSAAPTFAAWARAGELLFLSGQAAIDPSTLTPLFPGLERQADWCLDRVEELLAEAGASPADIARIECFLADRDDFAAWNAVYERRLGRWSPPRTTLVTDLPVEGLRIELQVTARGRGATPRPARSAPGRNGRSGGGR